MTQPPLSSFPPRANRADAPGVDSEAAREHAIRVLTDAYAYDVITDHEFERRLELLGLSATPAMIGAAVADLPGSVKAVRQAHPGYLPLSEGRISGFMSETRRTGPWRVPQLLKVRAVMSDMKVDLRYAAIPAGCYIDVTAIMANVSIIVPPGLVVAFDVHPFMASVRSDAEGGFAAGSHTPHVRVHGRAMMAEVRVRVRSSST